ncbi:MAG TPA: NrfD/PsrC family molybdoenzyme membrane anchor subunit [Anaerolineaceae bacterium]
MIEITGVGEELVRTWGWEVAIYLFLGGLVAGLMIFSGVFRLLQPGRFPRLLFMADLSGFPLLSFGMLFLLIDLSNKVNMWRLYTTFQISSPMSWGAWILLVTMAILALRFVGLIPAPRSFSVGGLHFFAPPPVQEEPADEQAEVKAPPKPSPLVRFGEKGWGLLHKLAVWAGRFDRLLAIVGMITGTAVGFYTGILLSTIPARPLWNTAVLAPLFLTSGLASSGAYLCLFLPENEHKRLAPLSILFCGIELLLILAYAINLGYGTLAAQRSGAILFSGIYGWAFWGLVVLLGLIVPAVLEQLEMLHHQVKFIPARVPPVLKLLGGFTLRIVIVYAGLLSFI